MRAGRQAVDAEASRRAARPGTSTAEVMRRATDDLGETLVGQRPRALGQRVADGLVGHAHGGS